MLSFAEISGPVPDEDLPYLRELLSADALCPASCTFVRGEFDNILYAVPPSPLHWSRQREWPWVLRAGDFKPHHVCLDVGSGWSVLKFPVARRVREVVCVDIDQEFVNKAEWAARHQEPRNLRFERADARSLPYRSGAFDRVMAVSVIEHMPDGHVEAVKECLRVTRPGGRCLFTFDVVVEGRKGDGNNFYLDLEDASDILGAMGVQAVIPASCVGAAMDREGVKIICLLACVNVPEAP